MWRLLSIHKSVHVSQHTSRNSPLLLFKLSNFMMSYKQNCRRLESAKHEVWGIDRFFKVQNKRGRESRYSEKWLIKKSIIRKIFFNLWLLVLKTRSMDSGRSIGIMQLWYTFEKFRKYSIEVPQTDNVFLRSFIDRACNKYEHNSHFTRAHKGLMKLPYWTITWKNTAHIIL